MHNKYTCKMRITTMKILILTCAYLNLTLKNHKSMIKLMGNNKVVFRKSSREDHA